MQPAPSNAPEYGGPNTNTPGTITTPMRVGDFKLSESVQSEATVQGLATENSGCAQLREEGLLEEVIEEVLVPAVRPSPVNLSESLFHTIKPSVLDDIGTPLDPAEREEAEEGAPDKGLYQPTLWWFTSTAFPLFSGTLGPIATLFSVCALIQTWRIRKSTQARVDGHELLFIGMCPGSHWILLFNFAKRIPYKIAQPLTITLWYLSSVLLIIPVGIIRSPDWTPESELEDVEFSQSYYYALISSVIYFFISTILLGNVLGTYAFHAYPPSFNNLTVPQRTLMLQTTSFCLYLALGAGVFSCIQEEGFSDMLYWADYTLTTVGLGSDFPLKNNVGRMVLIPYAAFGIVLLGLVVTSVRGLVLERASTKVFRRRLGTERDRWVKSIRERKRAWILLRRTQQGPKTWRERRRLRKAEGMVERLKFFVGEDVDLSESVGRWSRAEFELMRYLQKRMQLIERYTSLGLSTSVLVVIWFGGAVIFWGCDQAAGGLQMTYVESIYFSYTTLTTIGYGDFYPSTNAARPFFVIFTLLAIPVMTVFISNMADTIVQWVTAATEWFSRRTILPEKQSLEGDWERRKKWKARLKSLRHPTTLGVRLLTGRVPTVQREEQEEDLGPEIERIDAVMQQNVGKKEPRRPETLSILISKEIANTAKDIQLSDKQYEWSQWVRWLRMLGEEGETFKPRAGGSQETHGWRRSFSSRGLQGTSEELHDPRPPAMCIVDATVPIPEGWHWTWLSDRGPMLSKEGESQWITTKLCERLEDVIQHEIRLATSGAAQNLNSEVVAN